jgi:hypothetical protein
MYQAQHYQPTWATPLTATSDVNKPRLVIRKKILMFVSVEITNKMQPCNKTYYSAVQWRLNMFRVAYRSSSGALTVFAASGLHTHVVTGRSEVWLDYGRSPHAYVNQRLQIQLELLMLSVMPLETCHHHYHHISVMELGQLLTPVSRIQKSLQSFAMIPSASWGIEFRYPG